MSGSDRSWVPYHRLTECFRRLDANGDGSVTVQEAESTLLRWLRSAAAALREADPAHAAELQLVTGQAHWLTNRGTPHPFEDFFGKNMRKKIRKFDESCKIVFFFGEGGVLEFD